METLAARWYDVFMQIVQGHEAAGELREASETGNLDPWTRAMTRVVVSTFERMDWVGAAKEHRSKLLPVPRQEYLSLDAVAFDAAEGRSWRFPSAVFELENNRSDDMCAYAFWKVLCVRARLRVLICYRPDGRAGNDLVAHLERSVVRALDLEDRVHLRGDTLIVIGSRARADSFPYGFFKDWTLNTNTGRFDRR